MKNILLICLLTIFLLVSCVYADMGAPEVKPYKAYISNFEGAEYFDYQTQEYRKVNYGTEVYVIYEDYYSEDHIVYATAQIGVEKETNNAPYVQLKISDISILDNSVIIPDNISEMLPKKAIFKTSGNGAEMKKGPAEVYESSGLLIPNGVEIITFDYSPYEAWNYIEYEGTRGWVKLLDGSFYFYPEYQELVVLNHVRMEQLTSGDVTSTVVIPTDYKITDYLENNQRYFFTYNNTEGFLYSEQVAVAEKGSIEVSEDNFKIYSSLDTVQESDTDEWGYPILAKNIPKGTILPYEYRNPDQMLYYVEYNGTHGWAFANASKVTVEQKAKLRNSESQSSTQNIPHPLPTETNKNVDGLQELSSMGRLTFIAFALVFILTIIVVIVLIKRKDK